MKVALFEDWSAARLLIVLAAINPYGRHVADPITTASISTPFP
jgi:hypothetical protein